MLVVLPIGENQGAVSRVDGCRPLIAEFGG
jgi:hypothetical protein